MSKIKFPLTSGKISQTTAIRPPYDVDLDGALECHVFNSTINGQQSFTACRMRIPIGFSFIPSEFINNKLQLSNAITINSDMTTIALLNVGMSTVGHKCMVNGKFVNHGSAICANLARPTTNPKDIILLFKFDGTLKFPTQVIVKDANGNDIKLTQTKKITSSFYFIPLVLSDETVIYNAIEVTTGNDENFITALENWLVDLQKDVDNWKRIGIDEPFLPIFNEHSKTRLDISIATNMFFIDVSGKQIPFVYTNAKAVKKKK
jgi:hypothetical protein